MAVPGLALGLFSLVPGLWPGYEARAVCVAWLASMADSMTDRLRLLLTMSTHTYFIQPLLMLWALQRNKCRPRIVAAQKRAVKKKSSSRSVWSNKYGWVCTNEAARPNSYALTWFNSCTVWRHNIVFLCVILVPIHMHRFYWEGNQGPFQETSLKVASWQKPPWPRWSSKSECSME